MLESPMFSQPLGFALSSRIKKSLLPLGEEGNSREGGNH